ncbi:MAG: ABC transporter ATP-binding protein [Clostridia bacterium]|nr:ABC transporter ATP-binding protein [Clostridia bacterium]
MIKLDGVTKKYGEFIAVDSVSITINKGELLVILGPSGCGKSTTLRLINKMIPMTDGIITVRDVNINDINSEDLRKSIGYVIQSIGLFPHMSVKKNIATVPHLLNWDKTKIDKRIDEMLELVGLTPKVYREKKPSHLSGGEAQRVGVARALASNPDILLMDEPFGAVDPINRLRLQTEFRQIQQSLHKTVIFVTHDVDEALLLADRICIMDSGNIIQIGTPEEIVLNPVNDFVNQFFRGEGILNLLSRKKAKDFIVPSITESLDPIDEITLKEALSLLLSKGIEKLEFNEGYLTLDHIIYAIRGDLNDYQE